MVKHEFLTIYNTEWMVKLVDLTDDEKYLLQTLKNNSGTMGYKELNNICGEHFEGVRLILKKLKGLGFVNYEGMMPMFDSVITLTNPDF